MSFWWLHVLCHFSLKLYSSKKKCFFERNYLRFSLWAHRHNFCTEFMTMIPLYFDTNKHFLIYFQTYRRNVPLWNDLCTNFQFTFISLFEMCNCVKQCLTNIWNSMHSCANTCNTHYIEKYWQGPAVLVKFCQKQ